MQRQIKGFNQEWAFLSNFFPVKIEYEGIEYPSTEHAYQAAKFDDEDLKLKIANLPTAAAAKREGQKHTIREDWDSIKTHVMMDVCILKFSQPKMSRLLLESGDAYLEETNHWKDTFWGVCDGVGQNHLGEILMSIREDLKDILQTI